MHSKAIFLFWTVRVEGVYTARHGNKIANIGSHKMKASAPGICLVYTSNRTVNIADAGKVYFLYTAQSCIMLLCSLATNPWLYKAYGEIPEGPLNRRCISSVRGTLEEAGSGWSVPGLSVSGGAHPASEAEQQGKETSVPRPVRQVLGEANPLGVTRGEIPW